MAKKARTRANNGMGSVRQRKDGLWEARYTSPDGRQRSVYAKTEAEVTKKLRGALHELDTGAWREPSKMTVEQWAELWLRDGTPHISARTVKTYADFIRLHVLPVIGRMQLSKVLPLHVRRVIGAMGEKDLAPRTLKHCQGIMSAMFNGAIDAGLIRENPAKGVKTPRNVPGPLTIVDRDMIQSFIAAANEDVNGRAVIFLLLTGLRASEERGLKWDDIDLDAGTMRIQRQLPLKVYKGFTPPKDGSARTVELIPEAVELLREQRRAQAEARLAAGAKWKSSDIVDGLVFRSASGLWIAESVLYRSVRIVGDKIGLPGLHPHDLRHSYAVAALRSGMDVKTVQHNLGHRSAAMTLDVYAAYTTDAGKVGADKMSRYWQEAVKGAK